jgi:hypothetical protein
LVGICHRRGRTDPDACHRLGGSLRAAVSGIGLGMVAIGIQLFAFTVMLIAGVLVIASVIYALRDTFGDIFGGLFSG